MNRQYALPGELVAAGLAGRNTLVTKMRNTHCLQLNRHPPITTYISPWPAFRFASIHSSGWRRYSWGPGRPPTTRTLVSICLLWVFVVLVSILVHELGHAFVMRYFGRSSPCRALHDGRVGDCGSRLRQLFVGSSRRNSNQQMLISAAGPAAGFLLAGLTAGDCGFRRFLYATTSTNCVSF